MSGWWSKNDPKIRLTIEIPEVLAESMLRCGATDQGGYLVGLIFTQVERWDWDRERKAPQQRLEMEGV